MPYDVLHRHGSYMHGGKTATYIKMNKRPLLTKKGAINWAKKNTIGGTYRYVPHSKVKSHPLGKKEKGFRGLYYIKK